MRNIRVEEGKVHLSGGERSGERRRAKGALEIICGESVSLLMYHRIGQVDAHVHTHTYSRR